MIKLYVARVLGRLGMWLIAMADRAYLNWEPWPPRIVSLYAGELAHAMQTTPTIPSPPPVPDFGSAGRLMTSRPCSPPPPMPRAERRQYWCNGKLESVRPPAGTWWAPWWGKS
jgi:hypothetical protein